jgi:carboxyl-terminal processing protease
MKRLASFIAALALIVPAAWTQTPPPGDPPKPNVNQDPVTPKLDANSKATLLREIEDILSKRAFTPGVDFKKWPEFMTKRKEALDKAETPEEFSREINNALREFKVSHVRFMVPRQAQQRVNPTASGLGLGTAKDEKGLKVMNILPNSPAAKSGIKVGELIVEAAGKPATEPDQLRVDVGASLKVKVQATDGTTREVELTAGTFSAIRENTVKMIDDDAAVVRINSFTNGYKREDIEKLFEQAFPRKYLILDLRNNGGGAVANLRHLLNLLLPTDVPYGTMIRRDMVDEYAKEKGAASYDPLVIAEWAKNKYKTSRGKLAPYAGKIAVLINRGSASASEITALALKEVAGAILVGQPSRGAVLASIYQKCSFGYELQIPVSDYVSIKGFRPEGNPIPVDVTVEGRAEPGKPDPGIEAALQKLRGGS